MCGICGIVRPEGVQPVDLQPSLRALSHRGPDDEGVYSNGRIALGSRRLSIIDLAGGRQPISNEDQNVWVVCNGEIYNYRELRRCLQERGHHFSTASDTEVIVHLYEEYGDDCVLKLKGMFAFAVWDQPRERLLLARDHLGQKPLFYLQDGQDLSFASEVKGLLATSSRAPEMDLEAAHHYLSLRFIPSPRTMFRHVRKVPPAHRLVYHEGRISLSRYWQLDFRDKLKVGEPDLLELLRKRLPEVVRSHTVSDVAVGALLSGGLDSSTVVALMARECGPGFGTFAVGVAEDDFDEIPYARLVAGHCRTSHVEQCVEPDLIRSLPEMIWHLDEPSDPIAACMFQAAALASQHVKVVLGGDGGDELFAGFDRYRGLAYADLYARVPALLRLRLFEPLLNRLPDTFSYKNRTQQLLWLHSLARLSDSAGRYAEATTFFRFNHQAKEALLGRDVWRQVAHLDSAAVITRAFEQAPADDAVDRMLYTDYVTRLPEHSLMLTDRMSMAHGLEMRSPFLDHELVMLLASVDSRMKVRGRELKFILRRLARDFLPPAIVKRPKQGFMLPVAYWFRDKLHGPIRAFLLDAHLVRSGFFRRERVSGLLDEHRDGRADHHVRLWMLLNLELWHQIYIRQDSPAEVRRKLEAYL
jgi:asparagine synthase (glutamine-hydrolysing)